MVVRLSELEVIQRYSIATRGDEADRGEVIAALEADLERLRRGGGDRGGRARGRITESPPRRRVPPGARDDEVSTDPGRAEPPARTRRADAATATVDDRTAGRARPAAASPRTVRDGEPPRRRVRPTPAVVEDVGDDVDPEAVVDTPAGRAPAPRRVAARPARPRPVRRAVRRPSSDDDT